MMAFLPPIDLPDISDLCPPWLDSVFRKYENVVDEESALSAAEAELVHRSKSIVHQYSDITTIGRLNDGTDNMDDHEEEEEEEEGDPGDEEYESGGEGDMDEMDGDYDYLEDGNVGLEQSVGSPVTVSATITLPMPSTTSTTSGGTSSANATQQQTPNGAGTSSASDQDDLILHDETPPDNQS